MQKKTRDWLIALGIASLVFASGYLLWHRTNEGTATTTTSTTSELTQDTPKQAQHTPNYVTIKYRTSQVDIANPRFEYHDTSNSSFVRGAWYDKSNSYMIINLSGTYYHYCALPVSTWEDFKSADSAGTYYNGSIKGNYDCRQNYVPSY